MKKTSYSVIGVMAGSSIDGLDIAKVLFEEFEGVWSYKLIHGITIPYERILEERLRESPSLPKKDQLTLDRDFGRWIGTKLSSFVKIGDIDLIAIHGHTVKHIPEEGISWQLGDGSLIAEMLGCRVITDFRSQDILLRGQGAPLVPFGDFMLFNTYDACLNLGGICNISLNANKTAWDICPCNQILNHFTKRIDAKLAYDKDGDMAREGSFENEFYQNLSTITYFEQPPPKSLPNNFIPLRFLESVDPVNGLFTYCHFISDQIVKSLPKATKSKTLVTGGGAHNSFLIELIKAKSKGKIIVPVKNLIDFKESIIFGFLGLKRTLEQVNTLCSVTGASKDSSSGVIHLP